MARLISVLIGTIALSCHDPLVASFSPSPSLSTIRLGRFSRWMPSLSSTTDSQPPATTTSSSSESFRVRSNPPSWDDLASVLEELSPLKEGEDTSQEPQLTLYRDTNGWCPFCERVWVAVRAKGIPYRERLINLKDKPDWYKELVPTTLVPAVLIHPTTTTTTTDGDGDGEDVKAATNQRTIVWESMDILRALDEAFPTTPQLIHPNDPEYLKAASQAEEIVFAGFSYVFGGRNTSVTDDELLIRRGQFLSKLDELDSSLAAHPPGSFRLGESFTAIDAILIPTLERWRYQLPLTHSISLTEDRPNIAEWFRTMDSFSPYADRVAGDEYSWTAVTSTFQRFFAVGDGEMDPKVQKVIDQADAAADRLTSSFGNVGGFGGGAVEWKLEAARKLITNHAAVVKDCTTPVGTDDGLPNSQKELERAKDRDAADMVLRYAASVLIAEDGEEGGGGNVMEAVRTVPLVEMEEAEEAMAKAARVVAARICVPRDMSREAATVFRGVLTVVADRLSPKELEPEYRFDTIVNKKSVAT